MWIWRFGTPDKVEFDRLSKKYPGEIVYAPQTAHAINPVADVSTSRCFIELSQSRLLVRWLFYACAVCRRDLRDNEKCEFDYGTGRSVRYELKMVKIENELVKIKCREPRIVKKMGRNGVEQKLEVEVAVDRNLAMTTITDGALKFLNIDAKLMEVRERTIVVFEREVAGAGEWGSGVVTRVEENILQVGVLLETGANQQADGMIENVSFESVILASTECPSKVAAGIDAVEHALKRIAELCQ